MPYDWRTGSAVPAGVGVPRSSPYFYGGGGGAPALPAPRRAVPGQAGNPWAYVPGTGPKPPATGRPPTTGKPTPKPPADPWALLLKQIMGQFETPAQMEARVNREINAQIAAQKKLIDDTYAQQRADAMAQMQAQSLAGAAAAALNKDLFSAVGGEFNAAAGEIKGLAHGLSQNAQGATAGDVSRANAALGALGNAPVTEGGTFGIGGGTQQGVEEYRGGTLPGQMLSTQGEAANFGLAGMIGSQALGATQEAQAALMTAMKDIRANQSKAIDALAAGRSDLYHQYMADAKDSQIKYISLAQGLQAQQQAAATATKPITRMVNGILNQYDQATGRWVPVAGREKQPSLKTFKGTDGRTYVLHPDGTATLAPGQAGPKQPTQPNLVFKTFIGPDGKPHLWSVNPKTGVRIKDLGPTTGKGAGTTTKKLPTPGQTQKLVERWFYGTQDTTLKKMPKADAAGNPVYRRVPTGQKGQVDYQTAYRTLRVQGYSDAQARGWLDPLWGRGDRGRPYLGISQRNALVKAGVNKNANVLPNRAGQAIKPVLDDMFHREAVSAGITAPDEIQKFIQQREATLTDRYLTPAQVEALQAAGMLPNGRWVPGSGLRDSRGFSLTRVYLISHLG